MGNRLNERIRRTDQPYPQPEYPGASLQQDRSRNRRPKHPRDLSQQDGNRNPRQEHPGASLQQDGNRNEGTCLSILLILSSMFNTIIDNTFLRRVYYLYSSCWDAYWLASQYNTINQQFMVTRRWQVCCWHHFMVQQVFIVQQYYSWLVDCILNILDTTRTHGGV